MATRWAFNRYGVALALILVLALALAACSSDGDDTSAGSGGTSGAAAAAQQPDAPAAPVASSGDTSTTAQQPAAAPTAAAATSGGSAPAAVTPKVDRLVIGMPAPSSEGNRPNVDLGPLTIFQLRPMLGWLVGYGVDGEFEPMLGESWSVEPDGLTYRFKLREGVTMHNGAGEFTAKDVLHSWTQNTREDSIHPHVRAHSRVSVEIVNDSEVLFILSSGNAEYLNQLSRQSGSMTISSKDDFDSLDGDISLGNRPAASTGPYQYKDRGLGQSITFERVPWDHFSGNPDFPEIQMLWLPEASTRLAGILTDEIHVTQLPQDLVPQATAKGMQLVQGPITQQRTWMTFYGVYTDPDTPSGYKHPDIAFADVRVRKALNRAIDRDALNQAFFAGKAVPMFIDKMPRSKPYFNPAWETNFPAEYGYDPAAARALLADAGYGSNNPLEVDMRMANLPDYGGSEDVEEAIAGFWRDVGVKVSQVYIESTEFRNVNRGFGHKDLVTINASSNFDIQAWRVYNSHRAPRGSLELIEIDTLVDAVDTTLDEDLQNRLLRQLGDTAFPLHTNIPLFWLAAELVVNPTVVEAWPYPGSISRIFSHFETIKAAG